MFFIRKATDKDYFRIMEIYRFAQDFMIASGNPDQWKHTHPKPELIHSDIENGICYVICEEDVIHGVFAIQTGIDPTYSYIENGEWLNNDPYVTIHRIASDGTKRGIFFVAVDFCKTICSNIRVDTHKDNSPMLHQIEKAGFSRCGTIYLANGSPRIAFQWTSTQ